MLKLQLGSKIAALLPDWKGSEDLLTCDFFGALNYLPRQPYLQDFLEKIIESSSETRIPLDSVDWNHVEFRFWPRIGADDKGTEPDLVLISNRWVIIVEAKLHSNFGIRQPIREYRIGCDLAKERNLTEDDVYYMLISKYHLDLRATFSDEPRALCASLLAHTISVRWSDTYHVVDDWLQKGVRNIVNTDESVRLLQDLCSSLRLRPALTFSGFRYPGNDPLGEPVQRYFTPELFSGFLNSASSVAVLSKANLVLGATHFNGFMATTQIVEATVRYFQVDLFCGFLVGAATCQLQPDGFGLPEHEKTKP